MTKKFNLLIVLMGGLLLGLILWNVFLMNNISELKQKNKQLEENYQDLDAFNEILKYDRETSRDSVRILEKMMNEE